MDIVNAFVDYQLGKMSSDDIVRFYQYLIDSEMLEKLDDSFKCNAKVLIKAGYCRDRQPMATIPQ